MLLAMSMRRTQITIHPKLEAEMTPEVRAFDEMLLAQIEALESQVTELNRRLGMNSHNSSLRDFQSPIDAGGAAKTISRQLKQSGEKLFHHWHRYRDGTITRQTMRHNIHKLRWPVYAVLEKRP